MSQQLNFAELKQRISVVQGAKYLGLTLSEDGQTLRSPCPVCNGDNRTLSLLEESNTFKCFKSNVYGSVLDLVCHVKEIGLKEAGKWLNEQESGEWVDDYTASELPDNPLPALEKLPKLDSQHEAVSGIGISPKVAEMAGIGFSNKGLMRGHVAVPVYIQGEIVGYLGVPRGIWLKVPANLLCASDE